MGDHRVLAGRYELGALIGQGGMADVHRAHDRVLGREVAVKVLRDSAGDASDRARFTSEARTLAQLSHSGLVMVLDAGITAEQPFLVMELVDGPTLAVDCAAGPSSIERAGSIGVQVADALAYAHDHGIIHRDVKPGNVLLGKEGRVKLADFGIARLVGDGVRHTRTGQAIGTAAYLAPEQVTGGDLGGVADVYSLGLVLLEALTGERAYQGPPTEAALARLHRQPAIPEHLPETWRNLLKAMTAPRPSERPSAREVAAILRTQPTEPIPVAVQNGVTTRPVPSRAADARDPATRLLTEPVTGTADAALADSSTGTPPPAAQAPAIDRWGTVLGRLPARWLEAARRAPANTQGVAAAALALVVLIVVVALVAGGGGSNEEKLPDNTPSQLRGPLGDLHDAVDGE